MVRSALLLVPAVVLVGVWLGANANAGVASVLGICFGLLAAWVIHAASASRVRRLSGAVNAWMGKTDVDPIELVGGAESRQLATAINSLGAAYARRGVRLEAAQPQIRELVLAMPEPAVLFDESGEVVAANDAAKGLLPGTANLGVTATQALGSAPLSELVRVTGKEREAHRVRVEVAGANLDAVATPFGGRVLLLLRDETEQLRVEALRRDFVANASHELKTPVAGIQSLMDALDVVLDRDVSKAHGLVHRMRAEADRLASLVNDLMTLRRVDGVRPTSLQQVDVDRMAQQVIAELMPLADEKGLTVQLDADGEVTVTVDPEDLRQIIGNLVANAIKYNRTGGEVDINLERDGDDVTIEVSDTGIGIPGKDVGRIFERFYRVDAGRSREAGGTGLGLSIVRHAVERNGGKVTVSSLLGKGSTFLVRLPVAGPDVGEG